MLGKGKGCRASCKIEYLNVNENNITCFNKESVKIENATRIEAGGFCMISCDEKSGKVSE